MCCKYRDLINFVNINPSHRLIVLYQYHSRHFKRKINLSEQHRASLTVYVLTDIALSPGKRLDQIIGKPEVNWAKC